MRRLLGVLGMLALVGFFVPGTAPAAPTAASVRCLQISPNDTPGTCTYKATSLETEVLSALALQGYTLDWVQEGEPQHLACTAAPCNEPGLTFTADAGTTIRVTVTQGVVVVRQVVVAGASV